MTLAPRSQSVLTCLSLFIFSIGLLGVSDFVYAADRTVVGELWTGEGYPYCPSAVMGTFSTIDA